MPELVLKTNHNVVDEDTLARFKADTGYDVLTYHELMTAWAGGAFERDGAYDIGGGTLSAATVDLELARSVGSADELVWWCGSDGKPIKIGLGRTPEDPDRRPYDEVQHDIDGGTMTLLSGDGFDL